MKKLFILMFILFLAGGTKAQQLSWRFTNPRIIRLSAVDHLQFDVQIKCDVSGTFLWAGTIKLNFNNTAFNNTANTWSVLPQGAFSGANSNEVLTSKYSVVKTITGTAPNKVYNIALIGDVGVEGNGPNDIDFTEIPTEWTTIIKVSARLSVFTGDALAEIDFLESGMNGFQQYITAPSTYPLYTNPNLFDSRDFLTDYTGRFYSTSYGWTQIGGGTNNVQYNNWATNVSTSVWEDASITQTDNSAALAKNLSINNGSTATPVLTVPTNKWLTVSNTLTNAGTAANLVVKSGASLIQNSAGVSATVEHSITGAPTQNNATMYHLVSRPFIENSLSGEWLGSYLFDYNELTGSWIANGASTTTNLPATKGYLVYYPGASHLYSHTGTLQDGTSTIPVTNTPGTYSGYNLAANLYPSALDFDIATAWGSVISNKIWIWSSVDGNYGSHIRGGLNTNSVTNVIASGQGFFVEATSSGNLTIDPTARIHASQQLLKNYDIAANTLSIKAKGNNFGDEIVVQFRDDATSGYDDLLEARKMAGQYEAPQLSSVASDNTKLSINALPFNSDDITVPLRFSLNAATDVSFTVGGTESFIVGTPVYLEDLLLKKMVDLRTDPVYTFTHTPGDAENRFLLRFSGLTGTLEKPETKPSRVFISQGDIFIDIPSMYESEAIIGVYDALGRQFFSQKVLINSIVQFPAPVAIGVYLVRAISGNTTFTGKVVVN